MSKYSREQLRSMARTVIATKQNGDGRYFTLCMSIALINNMSASDIEKQIYGLAV